MKLRYNPYKRGKIRNIISIARAGNKRRGFVRSFRRSLEFFIV
jgi:hypothetical protein